MHREDVPVPQRNIMHNVQVLFCKRASSRMSNALNGQDKIGEYTAAWKNRSPEGGGAHVVEDTGCGALSHVSKELRGEYGDRIASTSLYARIWVSSTISVTSDVSEYLSSSPLNGPTRKVSPQQHECSACFELLKNDLTAWLR